MTFLKHTITEVHDPNTGLIDGIRFADLLALSHDEMGKIVMRTVAGLRKKPTSDKLQPSLLKLYVLTLKLRDSLDHSIEDIRQFLRAPHPDLNYQTPLSHLMDNKFKEIDQLVEKLRAEEDKNEERLTQCVQEFLQSHSLKKDWSHLNLSKIIKQTKRIYRDYQQKEPEKINPKMRSFLKEFFGISQPVSGLMDGSSHQNTTNNAQEIGEDEIFDLTDKLRDEFDSIYKN